MLLHTLLLTAALAASPDLKITAPPVPRSAKVTRSAPGAEIGLTFGLPLRDPALLDALIAKQHDPRSALFRHWLTPEEFGARFGQSDDAYEPMVRSLESAGFRVERYPDRILIAAHGSVAQAEKLLGVPFYDVATGDLRYRTFHGTVRLPSAMLGRVESVSGLDTRPRFKKRLSDSFGNATLGPQDLRRFYDAAPLHTAGFAGQLSTVGVLGPIPDANNFPDPNALEWFYSNVSDSSVQFNLVNLGLQGGSPDTQGDKVELELDAEMSTIAAPLEQSITMVLAPPDQMFVQGYGYFVNQRPDITAVSVSYGNCELAQLQQENGNHEHLTDANLIAQGSAEGIAFFAASGDNGADDCQQPLDGATVDFPASIPYIVAVGGTEYAGSELGSTGAVTAWHSGDEVTWGDPQGAGGGGTSVLFRKPSYQAGFGNSATARDLPDLSLHAAPNPGVAFASSVGIIDTVGGTSDSSPMAAGFFALLNDAIGGCRIGAPQFELYQLGAAQLGGGAAVFHDITVGDLSQSGVYTDAGAPQAHAGFDDATGWGSIDMAALAAAWPPCPTSGTASGPVFLPDGGLPLDDAGLYDPGAFQPGAFDGGALELDGGRGAYDPCTAISCDGGAVCVNSDAGGPATCVTFCTPGATPSPCTAGSYCEPTSGTCQLGCLVTADCPTGFTCEGATDAGAAGNCQQNCDPAAADAGCPAGTNCHPSTDTCGTGCFTDQDCPSGKACIQCENRCVTIRDGGAVGEPCATRADCDTGEFCLTSAEGFPNGYCSTFCGPGTTCSCPAGATCLDAFNVCLASCTLGSSAGCAQDLVCQGIGNGSAGGCLPKCATDTDCNTDPTLTQCDTGSGICIVPGSTTSTSSSSGSTGASGSSGSSGSSGTTGATGSTGSTGSTGGATTGAGASSGSSGSSGAAKKSGCGCGAGDGAAALWLAFGVPFALARRRRQTASS